jgi:hypothetical protein
MTQQDLLSTALSRLSMPPMRTEKPVIVVAAGGRAETSAFFDVLCEFFPLVYVSKRIIGDLPRELLIDLCKRVTEQGVCPFLEAADIHQSRFSDLGEVNVPVHLVWVADSSKEQLSRTGKDRMEWLMSSMGLGEFYLVDPSEDLYPQIFSLPFLPGERR